MAGQLPRGGSSSLLQRDDKTARRAKMEQKKMPNKSYELLKKHFPFFGQHIVFWLRKRGFSTRHSGISIQHRQTAKNRTEVEAKHPLKAKRGRMQILRCRVVEILPFKASHQAKQSQLPSGHVTNLFFNPFCRRPCLSR